MCSRELEEREQEVVRILLVDDHATIRDALSSTFEREEDFEAVGQAGSMAEARRILAQESVDMAVIDLGLPDGYGADLIKELREKNPQAHVLVLSASLDRANIARAVERGAAGILNKTVHLVEVAEAVRRLRAGEKLMPLEEVVGLLRFAGSEREQEYVAREAIGKLTPRVIEVLQALAEGLDSKGIAGKLNNSTEDRAQPHVEHSDEAGGPLPAAGAGFRPAPRRGEDPLKVWLSRGVW